MCWTNDKRRLEAEEDYRQAERAMEAQRDAAYSHIAGLGAGAANRERWQNQYMNEYSDDLAEALGRAKRSAFRDFKNRGLITSSDRDTTLGVIEADKVAEQARLQGLAQVFSTGAQAQARMAQRRQELKDDDPVEYNISGRDWGGMKTQAEQAGSEYGAYRPQTGDLGNLDMAQETAPTFFSNYDQTATGGVEGITPTGSVSRQGGAGASSRGFPERLTVRDPLSRGSARIRRA